MGDFDPRHMGNMPAVQNHSHFASKKGFQFLATTFASLLTFIILLQCDLVNLPLKDKVQVLVSDYELDKLGLYHDMVARFAQALDVSADELLGLKASKNK